MSTQEEACRALWVAKIRQALVDAKSVTNGQIKGHKFSAKLGVRVPIIAGAGKYYKRQAIEFLTADYGYGKRQREDICDLIGICPKRLRAGAIKFLNSKITMTQLKRECEIGQMRRGGR